MSLKWRIPVERQNDGIVLVAITQEGKQQAETYTSGGPRFDVLATLNEHTSMTVGALARETNLDISRVKHILRELAQAGYVRRVQQPDSEG